MIDLNMQHFMRYPTSRPGRVSMHRSPSAVRCTVYYVHPVRRNKIKIERGVNVRHDEYMSINETWRRIELIAMFGYDAACEAVTKQTAGGVQ